VLTDIGVLAVFIIAENRSPSQSFLLRDDRISLQSKTTNDALPKPVKTDVADDSGLEGSRKVGLGLAIVPMSLSLAQASMEIKAIQDSLFDKTLFTQSVSPGKSAEGFAFFKFPGNQITLNDLLLRIEASEESTQSTLSFEFGL